MTKGTATVAHDSDENAGSCASSRVVLRAKDPPTTALKRPNSTSATSMSTSANSELSRLFIVCGRGRKVEDLHKLFASCGAIKNLHLALDRSNRSRGFAFLQYEDPRCAMSAIEKFDQMKLNDGHVLKVTIAREKPSLGHGKLKRSNQHTRQDQDEKSSRSRIIERESVMETRLPGKRQRSSPSVSSECSGSTSSRQKPRYEDIQDFIQVKKESSVPFPVGIALPFSNIREQDIEKEVAALLESMLSMLEQAENGDPVISGSSASQTLEKSELKMKHSMHLPLLRTVNADEEEEEESSTAFLTSSISSVSLATTPTAASSELKRKAAESTTASKIYPSNRRLGRQLLRRRRESFNDSDSSLEYSSDASWTRRKRSNTMNRGDFGWSTPRKHKSQREISLSPASLASASLSKKHCKREPTYHSTGDYGHGTNQRATQVYHPGNSTNPELMLSSKRTNAVTNRRNSVLSTDSKLFFTSTYKFTRQELNAMFSVYGDFEYVELAKSFGRIRTMAYIKYSKPSTASLVLQSFQDEILLAEDEQKSDEFVKLSLADESEDHDLLRHDETMITPTFPDSETFTVNTSSIGSTDIQVQERRWLLVLYDRFLASHVLSACVSSFSGMEFVDIKVSKSTGESLGVAFVMFASETQATDAAQELHQRELPSGSGKYLQAIVILDPSLFSTSHAGVQRAEMDDARISNPGRRGNAEDVDVCAVEARFAHLMGNNEQHQLFPMMNNQPAQSMAQNPQEQMSGYAPLPPVDAVAIPTATSYLLPQGSIFYSGASVPVASSGPPPFGFIPHHQPYPTSHFPPYGITYAPQVVGAQWMDGTHYFQHPTNTNYPPMNFPPSHHQPAGMTFQPGFPVAIGNPNTGGSSGASVKASNVSSGDSSETSCSIYVSSSRPLELVALVKVMEDCPGVVAFTKDGDEDDNTAYVVEFQEPDQAAEAVEKLDGRLCDGLKLRVARTTGTAESKLPSVSSQRKRQRIDARGRK